MHVCEHVYAFVYIYACVFITCSYIYDIIDCKEYFICNSKVGEAIYQEFTSDLADSLA